MDVLRSGADQIQTSMRKTMASCSMFLWKNMENVLRKYGQPKLAWANCPSGDSNVLDFRDNAMFDRCEKWRQDAVQRYADKLTGYLNDIVAMVRGGYQKCPKNISALCVLDVHSRDTIQDLANTINSPMDFDWLCQLRCYSYS